MNTKVTLVGLKADIEKEKNKIKGSVNRALNYVGAEMVISLQDHLQNDWYRVWKGKQYKRRTDGAIGVPLASLENFDVLPAKNGKLTFEYLPTGEYPENNDYHTNDGDDLIRAIQNGYLGEDAPARPFWDNFVNEQETSAVANFVQGMANEGYTVVTTLEDTLDLREHLEP